MRNGEKSEFWGHTESRAAVIEAAWLVTREDRSAQFHQRRPCPTYHTPYGKLDPNAERVSDICRQAGCLDLLHDLMLAISQKLATVTQPVDNWTAYCGRVARRELIELKRSKRVLMGLPAKPGRADGVAGRINRELLGFSSADWLIALFRIMRNYPFSTHHVPGRWPIDGLVAERLRRLPEESATQSIIRGEIRLVLEVATRLAGHEWVYTNLTLPLNAHADAVELQDNHAVDLADPGDRILATMLRDTYQRNRSADMSQRAALAAAAWEVMGLPLPSFTKEVSAALRELEPLPLRASPAVG